VDGKLLQKHQHELSLHGAKIPKTTYFSNNRSGNLKKIHQELSEVYSRTAKGEY